MRAQSVAVFTVILIAAFVSIVSPAHARPYLGDAFTYHQPDGSTFLVQLYGDEFFAYQRTEDGREVVLDPSSSFWCYARLSKDRQSFESTGVPVVTAKPGSAKVNLAAAGAAGLAERDQTLAPAVVLARVHEAQAKFGVDEKGRPLPPSAKALTGAMVYSPPENPTSGNIVGLCILVDFPDEVGTITQGQVSNFCNQPSLYTEFGNACSINEYFSIQSNDQLNYTNIVTAYVRMPHPKAYYDDNIDGSLKPWELINTALQTLMDQNFDFTQLTLDASGYIRCLNVFYAGTCSSGWARGLWPHTGWLGTPKQVEDNPPVYAQIYQMCDMKQSLSIGMFCHENGHMMCDFPDLYSYITQGGIVGYYSLMAFGCCSGALKHPSNVDPYLKIKAGWADIVEVTPASCFVTLADVDVNHFYRYMNTSDSTQYFIVENRNNTGYEGPYGGSNQTATPGRGLVVWQVYEGGSNVWSSIQEFPGGNDFTTPYEAFIIEATPEDDDPWYSYPSPGPGSLDTFYSGQGVNPLNDTSSPDLRFWDTVDFTGRTVRSGLVIRDCGVQGSSIRFTIESPREILFPYANTNTATTTMNGSPWGAYNNYFMWKIDASGNQTATANYIWNNSVVFYDNGAGGYMNYGGTSSSDEAQMKWSVAITNPSGADISGPSRIKLYIYKPDGTLVDETAVWNNAGTALINTAGGTNIQWDSAQKCFLVYIPGQSTVLVNNAWAGDNQLYNDPPPYTPAGYSASIRLVQRIGRSFTATFKGTYSSHWRTSKGASISNFSPERQCWQYRYKGIDLTTLYPTGNMLLFPNLQEKSDPGGILDAFVEHSNVIYVVNADDVAHEYTADAYSTSGGLIGSATKTLSPWQRWVFAPSQFANSAADTDYRVDISGPRPVATNFQIKYTKSNSSINSKYTRLSSTNVMDPYIYP